MNRSEATSFLIAILAVLAVGATGVVEAQTFVPGGVVATDTTWTAAGSPYIVQGDVSVFGTDGGDGVTTLTIEPGVTVAFDGNFELVVGTTGSGDPGALIADAGGGSQILFTSNQTIPAAADWERIRFENTAHPSTVLNNVRVEYGGSGFNSGSIYGNQGASTNLQLIDVTVRNSAGHDIRLFRGTFDIDGCDIQGFFYNTDLAGNTWDGCTFTDWGDQLSRVGLEDVDALTHGNTFLPGADPRVEIWNGQLNLDASWGNAAGRLIPINDIHVVGSDGVDGVTTLTIEPGTTVAMNGNFELIVGNTSGSGDPGALIANAAGQSPIVFTTNDASPAPGAWERIRFALQTHPTTVLNNVRIEYAGSGFSSGAIYANQNVGVTLPLIDVTIENSATHGIRLVRGILDVDGCDLESFYYVNNNPRATWDGCTFRNWGDRVSRVGINDVDAVTHGNTFVPGADPRLEIWSGTASEDRSWGTAAGRLIPLGDISIFGTDGPDGLTTLIVEPGATVAMGGNYELIVGSTSSGGNPGALVADASGQPEIVFTTNDASPAPGAWERIRFEVRADPSTILRNVRIEYAGSGFNSGSIYAAQGAGTTIPLIAVRIQDSATYGIRLVRGVLDVDGGTMESFYYNNNTPRATWDGVTFQQWGDLVSRVGINDVQRVLQGNTFVDGADPRLEIWNGTVTEDATWSTEAGRLIPVNDIVVSGVDGPDAVTTLTVAPGTTIAMDGNYEMIVGSTSSGGNPGALVADALGQPQIRFTTNDASPAPGAWERIRFELKADASSILRNVLVEYAGSGFNSGAIFASQGSGVVIPLVNVTVQNSATYDIRVNRGTLDVDDCDIAAFYYNNNTPRATWDGCTFRDWGDLLSRVNLNDVDTLTHGNTFLPGADPRVEVWNGTADEDASWGPAAGRLVPINDVSIFGADGPDGITTVTIEPGVTVAMGGNYELIVGSTSSGGNPGALVADAGGQAQIVFTSNAASPAPGDWERIRFEFTADPSTVLRNVRVRYAGSGANSGVITANQSTATPIVLDQVEVLDAGTYDFRLSRGVLDVDDCSASGLYYGSNTPRATWDGCTFDNWGARTSRVGLADVDALTHGNTFNAVPGAFTEVVGGTVGVDASWAPAAGPLHATTNIVVQGADGPDGITTLQLEGGTTLKFPSSGRLDVGSTSVAGLPGALLVDGLTDVPGEGVNLTSRNAVPSIGDWLGVRVYLTGRADLTDVQILFADIGLQVVNGTLGTFDRVAVNRADVGFEFIGTTFEQPIDRIRTRNVDIGVRTNGSAPVLRRSDLVGTTWGVQNLTPATDCVDAIENWWGDPSGPSGAAPAVGCNTTAPPGTGSAVTDGVLFDPWLDAPDDDGDGVDADDGDGFPDPCTGGNTIDCDDNCPLVSNPSQADEDSDGVGDACDTNPSLTVSNDPADGADFDVVQDAVDAAFESGSTVRIFPGLAPYAESVRLDVRWVFTFVRADDGSQPPDPVIVDGGAGPAFQVINKVGSRGMRLESLTLRGDQGVRALVDTDLVDLTFDGIVGEALALDAGSHRLVRGEIDGALVGADVADGADLALERVRMVNLAGAGVVALGAVSTENVLIAGGVDGIRVAASTGSADVRYTTIANNTGVGIDNDAAGAVTVDRSIVWNNALDDLSGVACAAVTWSDVGVPDCSAVGDNVAGDPLLDPSYGLQAGSACLDHGPDPALYAGAPPADLDGGPRLLDADGDGLANNDCGAFEYLLAGAVPGEVVNLRWFNAMTLEWDPEPTADEYHVYRDDLANLAYTSFGTCRDDLDGNRTDTQLLDAELPAPGQAFLYLITAETAGEEGTLGFATTAERSNFPGNVCP